MLIWLFFCMSLNMLLSDTGKAVSVCNDYQEVLCSASGDEIVITGNSATLEDGRNLSCAVTFIQDHEITRVNETAKTAVTPDFFNVDCHRSFSEEIGDYKAVLDVLWASQEYHIRSGLVKGYLLDFGLMTYSVTLNFKGTRNGFKAYVPNCVKFMYNLYGEYQTYLKPGEPIHVRVRPLPRSKRGESSNKQEEDYMVPDVSKCRSLDVEGTISNQKVNTTVGSEYFANEDAGLGVGWIAALAILALGIALALFVTVKRAGKFREKYRPKSPADAIDTEEAKKLLAKSPERILIIANRQKENDVERAHSLAVRIRQSKNVQVTCNFENVKVIAHDEKIVHWLHDQWSNVDTIILINGGKALSPKFDNEGNPELSYCVKAHLNTAGNDMKKMIFLEDEPDDLRIIDERRVGNMKGFPFKSHSGQDEFFEKLFGFDESTDGVNVSEKKRKYFTKLQFWNNEQREVSTPSNEERVDGVQTASA